MASRLQSFSVLGKVGKIKHIKFDGKGKKELTNGQMKRVVLAYRKLIGSLYESWTISIEKALIH